MPLSLPQQIINNWTGGQTLNQQVISLFEKIRDIPYGSIGSRDPFEVYRNNTGTCSGKHELLKTLYHELGIQTQDYIAMHRFIDMPVQYPERIVEILKRSDIIDPHNFFKILVDEKWVTIDVTWDKPLHSYGFPVNENWDGKRDMQICVKPLTISQTNDPIGFKKQELAKLPETVQKDRLLFLDELTKWVATLR